MGSELSYRIALIISGIGILILIAIALASLDADAAGRTGKLFGGASTGVETRGPTGGTTQ
jgi:hypothetical protein